MPLNKFAGPYITGQTLYFVILNNGQWYNSNTPGFENFNNVNYSHYETIGTEAGSTGIYTATFPSVAAGIYDVCGKLQAGVSPAATDLNVLSGTIQWDGTNIVSVNDKTGYSLASSGLDAISIAAPAGVAGTFREVVVQIWRRFFAKVQKDSAAGTIKTFADDGTTVKTTQVISTVGSVDTVGPAS